jgi:hypothetical protein
MNAIEVIAERIEQHVDGGEVRIESPIFEASREAEVGNDVRVVLYPGTVEKGSGLRSELFAFTVYVFDAPNCENGYTQVTVNFDTAFDPINYLYYYEDGSELRLNSN